MYIVALLALCLVDSSIVFWWHIECVISLAPPVEKHYYTAWAISYYYYYYYYYLHLLTYLLNYLLQLSCHSVAVVLTLVQTKQIRINIHQINNIKHSTINTKHSKCKYTYYQNIHTVVKIIPHTLTHILQNKLNQPQYKIHTKWNSRSTIKYIKFTTNIRLLLYSVCQYSALSVHRHCYTVRINNSAPPVHKHCYTACVNNSALPVQSTVI